MFYPSFIVVEQQCFMRNYFRRGVYIQSFVRVKKRKILFKVAWMEKHKYSPTLVKFQSVQQHYATLHVSGFPYSIHIYTLSEQEHITWEIQGGKSLTPLSSA